MEEFITLSTPNLKGNELKYVTEAVKDEWVSTAGGCITDFEQKCAEYVHAAGAVACQSGTAGLHLSLLTSCVKAGDEVIVPALTFIAAVNPVAYVGAHPVFMDCDDTLCMDMQKLSRFCAEQCDFDGERLINKTSGRQVKAVLVVHVFGNLADMEALMEIADRYKLTVIEDATEALGSRFTSGRFEGKFAGTIGSIGVYSFNGNKIITTGGGGMVVSNNTELLAKVKYLSTQAKDDTLYFVHGEIGYNYRMTNVQAAMGLAQLEQLESFIETKARNYEHYIECGVPLLPFRDDIRTNHWFYSYITDRRDELIKYLGDNKVQSRPIWYLICELEPYTDAQRFEIERARYYWEHVVNLPCSTHLTSLQVKRVAGLIKSFESR